MKNGRIASMARVLAVLFGLSALAATAADFSVNKLTYSNSSTIVPGEWTCSYSKAKSYADSKNIPIVVFYANPGCGYCNSLISALGGNKTDFTAWRKARGYVMVFAYGTKTNAKYGMSASDGNTAYSFVYLSKSDFQKTVPKSKANNWGYPFIRVYWKKGPSGKSVSQKFVGRSGVMPVTGGTLTQQFMNSVDSLVGAYASMVKFAVTVSPAGAGTATSSASGGFAGDRVTLKAAAKSGSIFSGWFEGDALLSQDKSYSYTLGKSDATVEARFVTKQQDLDSIALSVLPVREGPGVAPARQPLQPTKTAVVTNTVQCGLRINWPVLSSALTATTVSASGLPSGLKVVRDKATGEYFISGVPTSVTKPNSRTGVITPKVAKIKVTTGARNTKTYPLAFVVRALDSWATGTFNGGGDSGQVTLTVSAAGKVSGKALSGGKTWTLSASAYETYDSSGDPAAHGELVVLAKNGRQVMTNQVAVSALAADPSVGGMVCKGFSAYQNRWKAEPRKTLAKAVDKTQAITVETADDEGRPGTLKFTFGSSGTVQVRGVFTYGYTSRGAARTVSKTGSAVLCAQGGDNYGLYVYLAPQKDKFSGILRYFAVICTEGGAEFPGIVIQ